MPLEYMNFRALTDGVPLTFNRVGRPAQTAPPVEQPTHRVETPNTKPASRFQPLLLLDSSVRTYGTRRGYCSSSGRGNIDI